MDFIQYLQMRHHKHGDQEWKKNLQNSIITDWKI